MSFFNSVGRGLKSIGKGVAKGGLVILDVVSWVGGVVAGIVKIFD